MCPSKGKEEEEEEKNKTSLHSICKTDEYSSEVKGFIFDLILFLFDCSCICSLNYARDKSQIITLKYKQQ